MVNTQEIRKLHSTHRWSGWPGAMCLKCGVEDVLEFAIGTCYNPVDDSWDESSPDYPDVKQACENFKVCPHFDGTDPYKS